MRKYLLLIFLCISMQAFTQQQKTGFLIVIETPNKARPIVYKTQNMREVIRIFDHHIHIDINLEQIFSRTNFFYCEIGNTSFKVERMLITKETDSKLKMRPIKPKHLIPFYK